MRGKPARHQAEAQRLNAENKCFSQLLSSLWIIYLLFLHTPSTFSISLASCQSPQRNSKNLRSMAITEGQLMNNQFIALTAKAESTVLLGQILVLFCIIHILKKIKQKKCLFLFLIRNFYSFCFLDFCRLEDNFSKMRSKMANY